MNYDTQQGGGNPATPAAKRHPNQVQQIVSSEQQQQLQDKGGQ